MEVEYCNTKMMWADILTKPLQGQQFRTYRAKLMNCDEQYDDTGQDNMIKEGTITGVCPAERSVKAKTPVPRECVGSEKKYYGNSGDFARKDVTGIKPDQGRISIGVEDRNYMDQVASAKVDNHSWGCQSNDEMTLMTQQQEAGKMSK